MDLGKTNYVFGGSRFLLTTVELPIVSQVIVASEHRQASCEGKWHSQEDRLAYFPSLLRHLAEGEWRRRQDGSGALTAREQQNSARRLYASGELEQRAAESKVVKMMVSNAGTKVANVGTTDSTKQAQSAG